MLRRPAPQLAEDDPVAGEHGHQASHAKSECRLDVVAVRTGLIRNAGHLSAPAAAEGHPEGRVEDVLRAGVGQQGGPAFHAPLEARRGRGGLHLLLPTVEEDGEPVSYTHLRAHETDSYLV